MVMLSTRRVAAGATAATVVAVSGLVALVAIGLFFSAGQPFGTINDLALLVMTVSLGPVMLAHYELGGVVPLWPARLSLAGAAIAVAGWALVQLAMIVGLVTFDYEHGASGAFAVEVALQVVIGAWIGGASLLAGRWLPLPVRSLGVVAGAGTIVMSIGLLLGGVNHPLTYAGGLGYQVVLPVWAFLLARVFRRSAGQATAPVGVAAA
jgi:hypothetical protein